MNTIAVGPEQFLFPVGTDLYEWSDNPAQALRAYVEYFSRLDPADTDQHSGETGIEAGAYASQIDSGEVCFTSAISDNRFPAFSCALELLDQPLTKINGMVVNSEIDPLTVQVGEKALAEYSWESEVQKGEVKVPCTFIVRLYTLSLEDEKGDTGNDEIQNTIMTLEIKSRSEKVEA